MKCPCKMECTDCVPGFQKIIDLTNTGLVIYRRTTETKDVNENTGIVEYSENTTEDIYILHNTKDTDISSSDYWPEIGHNTINCPRCRKLIENAQNVLKKGPTIRGNNVTGICDRCKMKGKPCVECRLVVKKFVPGKPDRTDINKERVKHWLKKIGYWLQDINDITEEKKRARSDTYIDEICHDRQRSVLKADVEQLFGPLELDLAAIRQLNIDSRIRGGNKGKAPVAHFPQFKDSLKRVVPSTSALFKDDEVLGTRSNFNTRRILKPESKILPSKNIASPVQINGREKVDESVVSFEQIFKDTILGTGTQVGAKTCRNITESDEIIGLKPTETKHSPKIVTSENVEEKSTRQKSIKSVQPFGKKKENLLDTKTKMLERTPLIRKYHSAETLAVKIHGITEPNLKWANRIIFPRQQSNKLLTKQKSSSELIKDTKDQLTRSEEEKKLKKIFNERTGQQSYERDFQKSFEYNDIIEEKTQKSEKGPQTAENVGYKSKEGAQKASKDAEDAVKAGYKFEDVQKAPKDAQKPGRDGYKSEKGAHKAIIAEKDDYTSEKGVKKSTEDTRKAEKGSYKSEKGTQKAPVNAQKAEKDAHTFAKGAQRTPKAEKDAFTSEKGAKKSMKDAVTEKDAHKFEKGAQKTPKPENDGYTHDKGAKKTTKDAQVPEKDAHKFEKGAQKTPKPENDGYTHDKGPKKTTKDAQVPEKDAHKFEKGAQKTPKPENNGYTHYKGAKKSTKDAQVPEKDAHKFEKGAQKTLKDTQRAEKDIHIFEKDAHKTPKAEKVGYTFEKGAKKSTKDAQVAEKDAHKFEKGAQKTPKAENDDYIHEKSANKSPKEAQVAEKDAHKFEKASQKTLKDAQKTEKDVHKFEKGAQKTLKDAQQTEKEGYTFKKGAKNSTKDAQITEKDGYSYEKGAKMTSKDAKKADKDSHTRGKGGKEPNKDTHMALKNPERDAQAEMTQKSPKIAHKENQNTEINAQKITDPLDQELEKLKALRLKEKAQELEKLRKAEIKIQELKTETDKINVSKKTPDVADDLIIKLVQKKQSSDTIKTTTESTNSEIDEKKEPEISDIIIGQRICKIRSLKIQDYLGVMPAPPAIAQAPPDTAKTKESRPPPSTGTTAGCVRYTLSDRKFIDNGWTLLPTEKVVRKLNVYRMRPAHPEFDWFEHNKKNKRLMEYDTGEKLAELDDNGRGRWFYRNGRMALDYYDAEELNAGQRFVIYSNGEPDERGRSRPYTLLATFDFAGNGIVFDHRGKIRLKYNQTEGVVLDRSIGPVSHWKWHTLNDPPVLQQVMIDTQLAHKDPKIMKMGGPSENKAKKDNEEMLAIEFDNFIKEKSKKLSQTFKPFQIKMKALKINEHFSLRVLDQATVYLLYRDGTTNMKLNIGMVLDQKEIVDTDTAEVGEVSSSMEKLPARTESLAGLQKSVAHAQYYDWKRTERERKMHPIEPNASVDKVLAGISRPLRLPPPPRPVLSQSTSLTSANTCKCNRKPTANNVYYDTRLY